MSIINKTTVVVDSKLKKIYRSVIEKSKKLDDLYKSVDSLFYLFQNETNVLREKLKTYCETLIFREPIEFGKKIEEILWRRCFYDVIQVVKSNKKNLKSNPDIEAMYRLHLSSAYGYYNHLILRIQSEFGTLLNLSGFLNFPLLSCEKTLSLNLMNQNKPEVLKEVIIKILHKLLICLGDLNRYQLEYDPNGSAQKDSSYYLMSLMLIPSNGMALNQLGTLFGSENYGCDAAYYYLYSILCMEPFQGAKENLKLIFLKNRKRYIEIKSKNYINKEENDLNEIRKKEIKKFLVIFLYNIDLILSQAGLFGQQSCQTVDNQKLQEMCQLSLQLFNSCMFYVKDQNNSQLEQNNSDSYLTDKLIFKLLLLILMTIELLKSTNKKTNQQIYFTTVAYCLVFFSHILNHTIIRFQQSLLNKQQQNRILLNQINEQDNVKQKKQNKTRSNMMRRRRHNSDSDTDESQSEQENESINSDDDTIVQSSDSGSRTRMRRKRVQLPTRRRVNVAKFLERENLSETELNILSNSGTDDSEQEESEEVEMEKHAQTNKAPKQEPTMTKINLPIAIVETTDTDLLETDLNTNSNFKQFSTELYSNLSDLFKQPETNEYLIDNEIYKFILNGKLSAPPPGFEKEIKEIQEISEKIANFQIETDTDNLTQSETELETSEDNSKQVCELLEYQTLLPSVKIFFDWLLCNKNIIKSVSNVDTSMWSKLAVLLNLIPLEKQISNLTQSQYIQKLILNSYETKSWNLEPLSEDIHLRSFSALKQEHLGLKFDLNKLNQLSIWDEHLLRLCSLRRFGYLLASLSRYIGANFFEYNTQKSCFISFKKNEQFDKKKEDKEPTIVDRKLQLMKSMAQLRLEAEISQLESSYKNDEINYSPYLVADTQVLCSNLKLIQELSKTGKFLIIIPLGVIDQIDLMKKESRLAREAIKWLEIQFRNGNRFLRAQNQNESAEPSDTIKTKKDLDLARFEKVLNCCLYFQNQTNNEEQTKKSNMVTLLLNKDMLNEKQEHLLNNFYKDINWSDIKEFYDKWKKY